MIFGLSALATCLVACGLPGNEYALLEHVEATDDNIQDALQQATSKDDGWYDIVFVCTSAGSEHSFRGAGLRIEGAGVCGTGIDDDQGPELDRCIEVSTIETITVQRKYLTIATPVGFPKCPERQAD
ncbi:MAG: hypothetical protein AAFX02_06700 [Pseudomonadota bacterium]